MEGVQEVHGRYAEDLQKVHGRCAESVWEVCFDWLT